LHKHIVKLRICNSATQMSIWYNALWRTRDIKALCIVGCKVDSQLVDQIRVVRVTARFDIQIETVDDNICAKRSRECGLRGILRWTICAPKKVRERLRRRRGSDEVARTIASQRDKDFLSSCLAYGNILRQLITSSEHLRLGAIWRNPIWAPARVCIVRSGISIVAGLIGKSVDETNRNDIDGRVLAEVCQSVLVRSLSPVDGKVQPGGSLCRNRSCLEDWRSKS